jgi:hypothetical protein
LFYQSYKEKNLSSGRHKESKSTEGLECSRNHSTFQGKFFRLKSRTKSLFYPILYARANARRIVKNAYLILCIRPSFTYASSAWGFQNIADSLFASSETKLAATPNDGCALVCSQRCLTSKPSRLYLCGVTFFYAMLSPPTIGSISTILEYL